MVSLLLPRHKITQNGMKIQPPIPYPHHAALAMKISTVTVAGLILQLMAVSTQRAA